MPVEFRTINPRSVAEGFDFPVSDRSFSVRCWDSGNGSRFLQANKRTHYGFVSQGQGIIQLEEMRFDIRAGMYFCIPENFTITGECQGILMSSNGIPGIFQIGGPIESTGRLRYIDGCSDTLLISPTRIGLPCVNHLQIPPQTLQRFHTHPSFRFGMITKGRGYCDSDSDTHELVPGIVFYIPANGLHRFRTDEEELTVIAFHPDSDFGPDDTNHPMVNKTIVDGVSAAKLSMAERQVSVSTEKEYRQR